MTAKFETYEAVHRSMSAILEAGHIEAAQAYAHVLQCLNEAADEMAAGTVSEVNRLIGDAERMMPRDYVELLAEALRRHSLRVLSEGIRRYCDAAPHLGGGRATIPS